MDYEVLLKLFRALRDHEVEYVIVGAVAMGLQGIARYTQDVDLFVRPTPANIERLRTALGDVWDDPAIAEIRAEDLAADIAVVNYVPPTGDWSVDVIARLGEMFRFDDIESMELDAGEGVIVRVATPRMLVRMKRDTLRPKDKIDALWLRERFGLEDV